MLNTPLERLLRTLELRLNAYGLLEMGRGWRLNPDPMESVVLHYVLSGQGFLESGGVRAPISAGAIVVVPPRTRKSFAALGEPTHELTAREVCALRQDGLAGFRACETQGDLVMACAAVSASCGGHDLFKGLHETLVERVEQCEPFQAAFAAMLLEFSRPAPAASFSSRPS